ncbi:MAG: glucans biosynthesis glucosyltransferase MdoH [Hyphomonadaceae bacterium]
MDAVNARPRRATPATPVAALPPEAPLVMRRQSFAVGTLARVAPQASPPGVALRRAFIFSAALALGAAGAVVMAQALGASGLRAAEIAFLALFAFLFTWTAFSFLSFSAGVAVALMRRDDLGLFADDPPVTRLRARTAILMPICNEHAPAVFARIASIRRSIAQTGLAAYFDIFVLSDSRAGPCAEAERAAFQRLRRGRSAPGVYYRRRERNTERKAGNIAEWVVRFGGAYAHMVILDADSLMTGDVLTRLAAAMERHPGVGLIQTAPQLVNRISLFARREQFAARLYGPFAAMGAAWWAGAEGNYWGHNAIIRVRAFAECCALPHLRGRAPFGGHIMSHDFVEAALLRRGGWAVHCAPWLIGSYEESPPTLMDMLDRDRRWCQGNMQHIALIGAKGFHWISRFHLLRGVLNYLVAPLWVALVAVGALLGMDARQAHAFGAHNLALLGVLAASMAMLIGPKIMALAVLLTRPRLAAFGGARRAVVSVASEIALSTLLAPVLMVSHCGMILSVVAGGDRGWGAQSRAERAVRLRELAPRFSGHMALGAGFCAWTALAAPSTFGVSAAAIAGLLLATHTAYFTARPAPRRSVFLTPEESAKPAILADAARER